MTSSQASPGDIRHSIRETVRSHSGLFIAQGVIVTLLGVAALVWPEISSLAVALYVGWVLLISGVVGLGLMFFTPRAGSFVWAFLTSALTLFAGVILLWHPIAGTVSLTLVLTAFFLAEGLFQIVAAITHRNDFPESWGWMALSGGRSGARCTHTRGMAEFCRLGVGYLCWRQPDHLRHRYYSCRKHGSERRQPNVEPRSCFCLGRKRCRVPTIKSPARPVPDEW